MRSSTNTNALLWGLAGVGALLATKVLLGQRRKEGFSGKTVVITGGSRGLGLVMARMLAQEGARIAICARDEAELQTAETDLRQHTQHVMTYRCDLTDRAQVDAFIGAVGQTLGPIDVLINNAGIIIVTPLEHATEADFRDAMDANFWAAFHTTQAVLPQMRGRKQGRIVNIASFAGKVPVPHLLPYTASKFALVGYSEGLRTELLKDGIYVTTVCPGLIRTGSPRQGIFRGQHEKEYAWFKIGDSLPLLTVSAETCARDVIEACRTGQPELIVSIPAKIGATLHGLMPGLTTELLTLVTGLLPDPGDGSAKERKQGKDSESSLSQSVLTRLTDEAAQANNQLQH